MNGPGVARVEVFPTVNSGWAFRAIARNGEIVASSEVYTRKDSAQRAARRLWPDVRVVDGQPA